MSVLEGAVTALSALSSLLSISASVKSMMNNEKYSFDEAFAYVESNAEQEENYIFKMENIEESVKSLTRGVISERLLFQYSSDAKNCENTHLERLSNTDDVFEKEEIELEAQHCMCSVLRRIVQRNGGKFPNDKILRNWWVSYNCKMDY